jgi:hypothetical protein
VTHPDYIREKARRLRVERNLSIDEIAERLALPRITIYGWVRELPLNRPRRENPHPGNAAMQEKYRALREAAYDEGQREFVELSKDPSFRDFVCMYIGEGYKRSRNKISLANSDPGVVKLAARWIRRFSRNPVTYWIQYHADQDRNELDSFWAAELGIARGEIRFQRKSNSGQLEGRNWRSRHGVLTVAACDTQFRARLQAWIDCVKEQWLDLARSGA